MVTAADAGPFTMVRSIETSTSDARGAAATARTASAAPRMV